MAHTFRVWAPSASSVDLVVADQVHKMPAPDRGWWERTVDGAGPGTRYGFAVNGGPTRPDPRSASQPDGIHGLSEVIDHGRYAWQNPGWRGRSLPGAVLYELHVGTFTPEGTFDGVASRLDHLVDLGVDAIELMPVAEFGGSRGWGYDGVDLFAPHHRYGGPDGLKRLVDACHGAGLGVVVDVVYNHLGPAGNYLHEFGPYFTDRHRTNWGDAVNFDGPGSHEVRQWVIDNAIMWLRDYRCDGLRLDAVHAIVDDSALHILEELATEVQALSAELGRSLFLIAESDRNDPRFVRPPLAGGYGLGAAWADEWHHAVHAFLTGERDGYYEDFGSLETVAKALRQAWVYDGAWSVHRQRRHGRPPYGLSGSQFVVCAQNHDQVGNRAQGERLAALASWERAKVAAAWLLTGPFTPMLFQGEEWGASSPFQYFTDHDPDLGRAVSDGRRREFSAFGWPPDQVPDPQDYMTFVRSKLDWAELGKDNHVEMLAWYRTLIALRRSRPELSDPRMDRMEVHFDEEAGWLVTRRAGLEVAANLAPSDAVVPVSAGPVIVSSQPVQQVPGGGLMMPADTVAVLERP